MHSRTAEQCSMQQDLKNFEIFAPFIMADRHIADTADFLYQVLGLNIKLKFL
jgi:hypothetical protein